LCDLDVLTLRARWDARDDDDDDDWHIVCDGVSDASAALPLDV
jgi:hypothetical protein